jgi:hypothetical protein
MRNVTVMHIALFILWIFEPHFSKYHILSLDLEHNIKSVILQRQKYGSELPCVQAAASFHAVDCNSTTSDADFQYASSNGQSVGTFQVNNGTFAIFQELNQRPTVRFVCAVMN